MGNENSDRREFKIDACIVHGCTAPIEPGRFMCDEHWLHLSRDHQQQFYRARYKYEHRVEGGDELLNAVMQTCAEAVEDQLVEVAGNVPGVTADRDPA